MELSHLLLRILPSLSLVGLVSFILYLFKTVFLSSYSAKKKLRMQGISGPSPSFINGNLPEMQQIQSKAEKDLVFPTHDQIVAQDYTSIVFPYFDHWRKVYGMY